jgi:hypothetical protein
MQQFESLHVVIKFDWYGQHFKMSVLMKFKAEQFSQKENYSAPVFPKSLIESLSTISAYFDDSYSFILFRMVRSLNPSISAVVF